MRIGAHVSTTGGLSTSIGRAQALGVECMQIFLCAPQRWQQPKHTDAEVEAFGRLARESGIGPNFAHAAYLINLASDDASIRERSADNLAACATWAERIGLAGLVVHVGSGKGQPVAEAEAHVARGLEQVLASGSRTRLLLENSAGSGDTLGARFEQIGGLLDRLGRDRRLGLCLDTAHTFASGYDLRTDDGIRRAVDEIEASIGLDRLWLIHANDSKAGLGSAVDRHANIGEGLMGEDAFRRLLACAALADLPWVLEIGEPANVQALKRLAGRAPAPDR